MGGAIVRTCPEWKRNLLFLSSGPSQRPRKRSRASSQTGPTPPRPIPIPSVPVTGNIKGPSASSLAPDQGGARLPTGRQSHVLGLFLANHWLPSQRPSGQQAQASRCPACHFLTLCGGHTELRSGWWAGVRTKPSSFQTRGACVPSLPGARHLAAGAALESPGRGLMIKAPLTGCSLCGRARPQAFHGFSSI